MNLERKLQAITDSDEIEPVRKPYLRAAMLAAKGFQPDEHCVVCHGQLVVSRSEMLGEMRCVVRCPCGVSNGEMAFPVDSEELDVFDGCPDDD